MAVFSRYSAVREFDGTQMSVRAALARINEVLDEVLSEQEGDFDPTTRFCLAWYRQHGYGEGKYGDAELLGNARGIAVQTLHRDEVLHSAAGKVHLFRPADLADDYDVVADDHTSAWEALHHLIRILEADGVTAAGQFLALATSRTDGAVDPELVTELARATGFPVTLTLMGLGAFPADHPDWLGMLGMHGTFEANMAMNRADLIIAVGARFDDRGARAPDRAGARALLGDLRHRDRPLQPRGGRASGGGDRPGRHTAGPRRAPPPPGAR